MPITENALREALETAFPDATISLNDMAGDNDHWQATVVSSTFEGKSRIDQHRMVTDAVKAHDIHALSIKTQTP